MTSSIQDAMLGAAGGVVGTAFIQAGMRLSQRLPETVQPPAMTADPGEDMVTRAEVRLGRGLPPRAHRVASHGLHWAYGIFWPMLAAAVGPHRRWRDLGRTVAWGAGLGAGVWAIGYLGWLPAAKLVDSGTQRRAGRQMSAIGSHVAYGVLSLIPLHLGTRLLESRRQRLPRRLAAKLAGLRRSIRSSLAG